MNTILVVDTSKTNLLYLSLILEKSGYQVFKANNGLDALKIYEEHKPHLVITELSLPFLSGIDLVEKIRAIPNEVFSPIFVVTNAVNSEEIQDVLMAGADDFLQKPYSEQLFLAKVTSLLRMRNMQQDLNNSKKTIEDLHSNLELEHQSAERIFEKFVHGATKKIPGLETHISPASIFNGDIFLSTLSPSGNVVLMLGDFTGHGLPAAIGAIPAAEVFYSMNRRGRTPTEIIRVMNDKLKGILPIHIFFGCILIVLDPESRKLSVLNAGMQPVVRINGRDNGVQLFESSCPPLGVLPNQEFNVKFDTTEVAVDDEVILFTDGVVEAMNSKNEMFGMDRLVSSLLSNSEHGISKLVDDAEEFTEGVDIDDDVSIAKLIVKDVLDLPHKSLMSIAQNDVRRAALWTLNFEFSHTSLQNHTDPIEGVVDAVMVMQPLIAFKEDLFVILSELFSNAVEHGLLGLSSEIKQQPNGFIAFAQAKQQALDDLTHGEVVIDIKQTPCDEFSADIEICVTQTSKNMNNLKLSNKTDYEHFSGRGIKLVKSLCKSLIFDQSAGRVCARYHWKQTPHEV